MPDIEKHDQTSTGYRVSETAVGESLRDQVSHEVRTPLTIVKATLQLLRRRWDDLDDEERRAQLDRALAHVDDVQAALAHVEDRAAFLVEEPLEPEQIDLT